MVIFLISATGCLATRAELRETEYKRTTQVSAVQERQAQTVARMEDYDQQFRLMNGRLDQVENQITQMNAGHADRVNQDQRQREELDRRFKAYEEALNKLESQVIALNEEVKALQAKAAKKETAAPAGNSAGGSFAAAEKAFEQKDWKLAILEYENYRNDNPKGKNYAAATLKIGMAFHELGKKEEAKIFFDEVVAKFPGSKEAKKASQRLKTMK